MFAESTALAFTVYHGAVLAGLLYGIGQSNLLSTDSMLLLIGVGMVWFAIVSQVGHSFDLSMLFLLLCNVDDMIPIQVALFLFRFIRQMKFGDLTRDELSAVVSSHNPRILRSRVSSTKQGSLFVGGTATI
jgi:hypothetical protein